MADLGLRNKWLLDAAEDGRSTVAQQIAWLQVKRRYYSDAISSGDWAVTNHGVEGRTSTQQRNITDQDNHDSIVRALGYLGATDLGTGGKIFLPQFGAIQR
jgi:hypothetical protein